MKLPSSIRRGIAALPQGSRLLEDRHFRTICLAVVSLIGNLLYAFYNGILGVLSGSLLFVILAVYYTLLCAMRFTAVVAWRRDDPAIDRRMATAIGWLLLVLSIPFHIMVLLSMATRSATVYGTIPMIAIATFTFTKITVAAVSAGRIRREHSPLLRAVHAIRYAEVAVSLLTLQQSMLVSFGEGNGSGDTVLNACTGAAVCGFVLFLGILTLKSGRKE